MRCRSMGGFSIFVVISLAALPEHLDSSSDRLIPRKDVAMAEVCRDVITRRKKKKSRRALHRPAKFVSLPYAIALSYGT